MDKECRHSWDRSFGKNMCCIAFLPDGKCNSAGDNRDIRVWWDAEGGVAIGGPLTSRLGNILFVSSSPDGQFLVSTTSYGIIVWDVGSRKKEIRAAWKTLFPFHWILFQQQDICSRWSAGDLGETRNALRHSGGSSKLSAYSDGSSSFCLVQVISVLFILNWVTVGIGMKN